MRITTQGDYGLRCMINIGKNCSTGPVPIRKIAEEEGLPRTYVEQLLLKLRHGNLIKSVRGAKGGYILARDPESITVAQMIEILEGSVMEVICDRRVTGRIICKYNKQCALSSVWRELQVQVTKFLNGFNLAELIAEDLRRFPRKE